jgi:hypothetical protein
MASLFDPRHLAIHSILDICDIRGSISSSWIMGMERLLSQNEMGCINPDIIRLIRRIHRSCQWNDSWYFYSLVQISWG